MCKQVETLQVTSTQHWWSCFCNAASRLQLPRAVGGRDWQTWKRKWLEQLGVWTKWYTRKHWRNLGCLTRRRERSEKKCNCSLPLPNRMIIEDRRQLCSGLHSGRTRGKGNRLQQRKFLLDIGEKFTVWRRITSFPGKLVILGDLKSSFGQVHRYLDLTWILFSLWKGGRTKSAPAF